MGTRVLFDDARPPSKSAKFIAKPLQDQAPLIRNSLTNSRSCGFGQTVRIHTNVRVCRTHVLSRASE
jgi:hypothetical protein